MSEDIKLCKYYLECIENKRHRRNKEDTHINRIFLRMEDMVKNEINGFIQEYKKMSDNDKHLSFNYIRSMHCMYQGSCSIMFDTIPYTNEFIINQDERKKVYDSKQAWYFDDKHIIQCNLKFNPSV